jgi:hypothetical protein
LAAAQWPLAQQIGVTFTSLGEADDTLGDKVVRERLFAWGTAEAALGRRPKSVSEQSPA